MRSGSTAGLGFVEVECIRVASEDHVTGLVVDSIVGAGRNIIKELVNSGRCVFCGFCLLVDY